MTRENARFAAAMTSVTRALPFGLSRVVAPSVVGYAVINLCTFFLDVLLLELFHGQFGLLMPISVTLSYGTAGLVSYAANRVFNFRSEGAVGKQMPVYVAVMASNYFIFVLGFTDLLYVWGVYFLLARVIAACVEGVYLYCCMRWLVFRDTLGAPVVESASDSAPEPASDSVPEPSSDSASESASDSVPVPVQASAAPGPGSGLAEETTVGTDGASGITKGSDDGPDGGA